MVVVLSRDYVSNKRPMEEVHQILEQQVSSKQGLCVVLPGISCKECIAHVLPEYAADLQKLIGLTALRGDQVPALNSLIYTWLLSASHRRQASHQCR